MSDLKIAFANKKYKLLQQNSKTTEKEDQRNATIFNS